MDEAPTIDLATTEQLITELMNRETFVGVIVAMPTDFVCALGVLRDPVTVQSSQKLSRFDVARMLAQATEIVVTRLRVEEKLNGDMQNPFDE
jgi:hypothetical protein